MKPLEQLQKLIEQKMQDRPGQDRAKVAAAVAQEQPQLIEQLLQELMPVEETAADETEPETYMIKSPTTGEMIEVQPVKKQVDAVARWHSCFASLKAIGLSHTRAIHTIDAKRPGLRQQFIAQDNANARQRSAQTRINATAVYTPPVAKAQPSNGVSFKAQWDAAVAAAKAKGLPNAKAVMEVVNRHPGLRESMLAEVNAVRPL